MKKYIIIFLVISVTFFLTAIWHYNSSLEVVETKLDIKDIKELRPKVALTFDDGPDSRYTEKLLDGLKERGIKATFFVIGESIEGNEQIIRRMYNEGHLIGNHTYTHVDLARTEYKEACEEILKTNNKLKEITGEEPKYIRPPYGDWNQKLLKETDMSIVLWNVDPEDWRDQNAQLVAQRIAKHTKNGDIVLLHDIFKTSVEAALTVADILKERGFYFVTVDKLENEKIISAGKIQNQ